MARCAIILLTLLAGACGAHPGYVARLDLDQIAADTALRDTAPGFGELPRAEPPPAAAGQG